jgi:hypothetical protein
MVTLKEFDAKLGRARDKLDLTKKYPYWFNKPVIRSGFIIIALVLFLYGSMHISDLRGGSVSCPSTANTPCINPFYECQSEYFNCVIVAPKQACESGLCDQQYLEPGEVIGTSATVINTMYSLLFWGLLTTFSLSVLVSRMKKPKVN